MCDLIMKNSSSLRKNASTVLRNMLACAGSSIKSKQTGSSSISIPPNCSPSAARLSAAGQTANYSLNASSSLQTANLIREINPTVEGISAELFGHVLVP